MLGILLLMILSIMVSSGISSMESITELIVSDFDTGTISVLLNSNVNASSLFFLFADMLMQPLLFCE